MSGTPSPDTKEKILDTAEKEFATHGYSVSSLPKLQANHNSGELYLLVVFLLDLPVKFH